MNIKYTLFKNDDFYYLLIGTWFDANKAGFLHLKHGIFTACEMDQITRKKQAIFDFNNHFRIYEFHADEKNHVENRVTVDSLFLYPSKSNPNLFKGRLRKGVSTFEASRTLKIKEAEIENAKPCTYEEWSDNQ